MRSLPSSSDWMLDVVIYRPIMKLILYSDTATAPAVEGDTCTWAATDTIETTAAMSTVLLWPVKNINNNVNVSCQ